jgi:hypothetical protein
MHTRSGCAVVFHAFRASSIHAFDSEGRARRFYALRLIVERSFTRADRFED